jgi:predicted nucleic-acid-binding Zn-ribbon protein
MKLYVICPGCGSKIYIKSSATTRSELAKLMGSKTFTITCPRCNKKTEFSVNRVIAESDTNATINNSVLGGLLGLLAGPIGAAVGATIGGIYGISVDTQEEKAIRKFNSSYV